VESTIITGQQGTYRHLAARVAPLLTDSGSDISLLRLKVRIPPSLARVRMDIGQKSGIHEAHRPY
jgi:hypothetical protein